MKQLIEAIYILHIKLKVFHGDIKTDNILVKGINNRDKFIIEQYNEKYYKVMQNNIQSELSSIRINLHRDVTQNIIERTCKNSNIKI
jgi:serine/threonine protein kinase